MEQSKATSDDQDPIVTQQLPNSFRETLQVPNLTTNNIKHNLKITLEKFKGIYDAT